MNLNHSQILKNGSYTALIDVVVCAIKISRTYQGEGSSELKQSIDKLMEKINNGCKQESAFSQLS